MSKIGVIGAGSWGTTLADLLAHKGHDVTLWVREEEVFNEIIKERRNTVFLPEKELDNRIRPTMAYDEALEGRELVLVVVPSHVFREVLQNLRPFLTEDMILTAATKGIENESLKVMSDVGEDVLPKGVNRGFSCLAGPSFAKEVCKNFPTAVTVACRDLDRAKLLQEIFHTEFFRVYSSEDILGCQLGGALKNVIAIAAGVSDALGFGHNARAALITRGLAEITRLGVAMGADAHTFAGLSGMGDLVLTCTADLSRNRTVGLDIGKGMSLEQITGGMKMVAEGVSTARAARDLGMKMHVEMPITNEVYEMLYEGKKPMDALKSLMTRGLKEELEYLYGGR